MKFLISNDDGVHAPGLLALYAALSKIGEVTVVAPVTEQSGCASALHISKPLYLQTLESGFIAVDGTPADCVYLALQELYCQTKFDCVITGINSGANLGQDVLFSGTFGAALSAQLFGIPAIATSLAGAGAADKRTASDQYSRYQMAAEQIAKLITDTSLIATIKDMPYHVLNVNIPDVANSADIKGCKVTSLGHGKLAKPVHRMVDPRGRDAYWLCLRKSQYIEPKLTVKTTSRDNPTDIQAVADGFISLSPVRVHHTPESALNKLSALAL